VTNLLSAAGIAVRAETAAAALVALLLGTFLVFGAGFASADALHAAAHDARHAFSFPCH
jgi:cobalt transporter subunit CbtB